jgi:hypothetical protein
MSSIPLIVLIDLDGTIVGDIGPQLCEWEILHAFEQKKLRQYRENLRTQLLNGVIRPHLTDFLDLMKHKYHNVEFYVYTASEQKWANYLIGTIEQVINMKFNRPIFCRHHCILQKNSYKKSPKSLLPMIYRKLREQYNLESYKQFEHNVVMIDNNNVLLKNEDKRLILCSTYDYAQVYDVCRLLDESTMRNRYLDIVKILERYAMFPIIQNHNNYSYEVFRALFFENIASMIKVQVRNSYNDTFWMVLGNIIAKNNPVVFKDSVIKYINEKLVNMVRKE